MNFDFYLETIISHLSHVLFGGKKMNHDDLLMKYKCAHPCRRGLPREMTERLCSLRMEMMMA